MRAVLIDLVAKWGRPGTGPNIVAFLVVMVVFPTLGGLDYARFFELVTDPGYWRFPMFVLVVIAMVISKRKINFKVTSGGVDVSVNGGEDGDDS